MKCPACSNEMTAIVIEGVEIDVCQAGCGGIWFDQFEFKKFDSGVESAGDTLLALIENPKIISDKDATRYCPRCTGQTLKQHFFSPQKSVEVDECYKCAGIFLDVGELKEIRSKFTTEEERVQAVMDFYEGVITEATAGQSAATAAEKEKAQRFANSLKWACPSAYIPGKQEGGAF